MVKLSKEAKQRLQQVFQCGQFVVRWGFIPTVLYLGFKRGADPGMPEPTLLAVGLKGSDEDHARSRHFVIFTTMLLLNLWYLAQPRGYTKPLLRRSGSKPLCWGSFQ